ncbi:hybrid sensor histidine kinase/response regulator [Azohydromonas lata]|uniref:histidine kinase n=1 Tax=Azohydromonas lata TaxID=45677 RepID=A0ABU5ID85_9BURK|nr:ATP-binding protein [Azohydromonas lata]MDZ5457069.1 response regulator [Azohydromonas lata]
MSQPSDATKQPPLILIVEDEAVIALDLKLELQDMSYRVAGPARTGEQALALAAQEPPALVLMDIRIQGALDGVETAARLGRSGEPPVIFLTSHSDDETVARAAQTAPYGFLTKPFQARELRAAIEVALARAALERAQRESDRWFACTLHGVQDGVIVLDANATLRFMNPAAEALTGWSAAEALGRPVDEVVRFAPQEEAPLAALQALREGRAVEVRHARQLLVRAAPGGAAGVPTAVMVDESAAPVEHDSGRRMGAVLVLRDATERLLRQEQLDAKRAQLQALQAQRDAQTHLLSRASHEMRTPLNAVLGFAQLLRSLPGNADETAQRYIGFIDEAGHQLLSLVEDLLDLQQGDELRRSLQLRPVPLLECVQAAIAPLAAQALASRTSLHNVMEGAMRVMAEPSRLQKVVHGLVSNAIKYGREGGHVWLQAQRNGDRVRITVADDGQGITADRQAQLFQAFSRAGREHSGIEGAGMGLVTARSTVQAMGGTLELNSVAGQGTVVHVELAAG